MSEFSHSITLPSLGLYYDGQIPEGTVTVREITGREQAILYGDGDFNDRVDALINACVELPEVEMQHPESGNAVKVSFDPMKLLDSDRYYILLMIRKFTWGSSYEFEHQCPRCGTQDLLSFSIEDIGVNNPKDDAVSEPVMCALPKTGTEVGYRFLRGADVRRLTQMGEQAKARGERNTLVPTRYAIMIELLNAQKPEWAQKYEFVQNLHGADLDFLRRHMSSHESGPQKITDVKCSDCGYWNRKVPLPLNQEFFRLEF